MALKRVVARIQVRAEEGDDYNRKMPFKHKYLPDGIYVAKPKTVQMFRADYSDFESGLDESSQKKVAQWLNGKTGYVLAPVSGHEVTYVFSEKPTKLGTAGNTKRLFSKGALLDCPAGILVVGLSTD